MNASSIEPPLVFVYLGNPLPRYARDSLIFAAGGHAGDIVLLTDHPESLSPGNQYRVHDIAEWYDQRPFKSFREKSTMNAGFRGGFWLHATERFFVLQQYMQAFDVGSLFHAELDVMVFDLDNVSKECDRVGAGIFAVMDHPTRALASLMYVNSSANFSHFLGFASRQIKARNEMEILGSYLQEHPDKGFALPCDRAFDPNSQIMSPSRVSDEVGLFDASAFGQWLFGLDPQNAKREIRNHFKNDMTTYPIDAIRFRIGLFGRRLVAESPHGVKRQVRTLHIHSKIVSRLRIRPVLIFFLWVNQRRGSTRVAYKRGHIASTVIDLLFSRRLWPVFSLLGRTFSQWFVRMVYALSQRSAVSLANSRRKKVGVLLNQKRHKYCWVAPDEVWLLGAQAQNKDLVGRILQEFPLSNIHLFSSIDSPLFSSQIRDNQRIAIRDAEPERAADLIELLSSSAGDRILVMSDSLVGFPGNDAFSSAGRHAFIVANQKGGEVMSLELGQESRDICFEPTGAFQPAMVRELSLELAGFVNSEREFSGSDPLVAWVSSLYSSWMWSRHKAEMILLGGERA